jgi:hypothetical protein
MDEHINTISSLVKDVLYDKAIDYFFSWVDDVAHKDWNDDDSSTEKYSLNEGLDALLNPNLVIVYSEQQLQAISDGFTHLCTYQSYREHHFPDIANWREKFAAYKDFMVDRQI